MLKNLRVGNMIYPMKAKWVFLCLLLFQGCDGSKPATKSVGNETALVFIGQPLKYPQGISVKIDENVSFTGEVTDDLKDGTGGRTYVVPPGKHFITVMTNGQIIYKKQVAVRENETTKIVLP